jgi:hypothetical protein
MGSTTSFADATLCTLHLEPKEGTAVVKKSAGTGKKKRQPDYGFCSVCQKTVLISDATGKVSDHQLPRREKCPGSGGDRFRGKPETCAVCGAVKAIRDSDGRIVSHKAGGQRCDGSGRSPAGGRTSGRMNALGVSTVVRAGSPGLGKRR